MPAKPVKPKSEFGQRLVEAFENSHPNCTRDFIAQTLGYKSINSIYKVLAGDAELTFDALLKFHEATGHTIDWLLTGDEPRFSKSDKNNRVTRFFNGLSNAEKSSAKRLFEVLLKDLEN